MAVHFNNQTRNQDAQDAFHAKHKRDHVRCAKALSELDQLFNQINPTPETTTMNTPLHTPPAPTASSISMAPDAQDNALAEFGQLLSELQQARATMVDTAAKTDANRTAVTEELAAFRKEQEEARVAATAAESAREAEIESLRAAVKEAQAKSKVKPSTLDTALSVLETTGSIVGLIAGGYLATKLYQERYGSETL